MCMAKGEEVKDEGDYGAHIAKFLSQDFFRNKHKTLEKKKVADEVKQEMISVAAVMAQKVVAANIDTTIQNTLVEQTLKEMGEKTWLN